MKDTYTKEEVIEHLMKERQRAVDIAYDSKKEHAEKYKNQTKVDKVREVYNDLDIKYLTKKQMDLYYQQAIGRLDSLNRTPDDKKELKALADKLMNREF